MRKITTLITILALFFRLSGYSQYTWSNVGLGTNLTVQTLVADTVSNKVYAGGIFTLAGGLPAVGVAKWNGTSWSPLGGGLISGLGVSSMIMSNNDLIVGGSFLNIGGVLVKNIARWNG